jgi:hypothetical protein
VVVAVADRVLVGRIILAVTEAVAVVDIEITPERMPEQVLAGKVLGVMRTPAAVLGMKVLRDPTLDRV